MTAKRFTETVSTGIVTDHVIGKEYNCEMRIDDKLLELLNELHEENEQLKKALLFFYDVANCECSTNWKGDMEKGCKRFFNCTYEEAEEKYGDYDGMWWELE